MSIEHADLILTGGRIFTGDAAKTWAEALAVGPQQPAKPAHHAEAVATER